MKRVRLLFPYMMLAIVVGIVVASNLGGGNDVPDVGDMPAPRAGTSRKPHGTIDVVCHMEVNPAWNYDTKHEGQVYHFCTAQCLAAFTADPEHYLTEKCIVCSVPLNDRTGFPATYLDRTYRLCSEEHRAEFKLDPAAYFMHTMWGIPSWLYYASIALVMVLSFGVFDFFGRRGPGGHVDQPLTSAAREPRASARAESPLRRWVRLGIGVVPSLSTQASGRHHAAMDLVKLRVDAFTPVKTPVENRCHTGSPVTNRCHIGSPIESPCHTDRFDLLSVGWIRVCLRSRVFRFVLQAMVVALFVMIIAAGLFGNQNPALNIAPILTWTVWWGMLIVLIMFAGKAWCYVCPWDAIAGWTEKLSLVRMTDEGLSLRMKWPRVVRNIWIATILFVGLTWIELGFGVTMKPRITAYLAIAMLLMAMVSALLFDRKSFCRYGCLVGRVSGLYALFAGTEVRSKDAGVCRSCRTKECVTGSESAYGCPTYLYPGGLRANTYCIQCMECVQACPHDNLAVNLRPWGSDLELEGKPRSDEAYLALLMLAITGFHGLTMTPVWQQLIDGIRGATGVGRVLGFSIGMAALMLLPIAIYAALVALSRRLGSEPRHLWRAESEARYSWRGFFGRSTSPTSATSTSARIPSYRDYFIRYAYALLPIALFYHVAHNAEHLLMEGPKVIAMISDPFGWGWNLLGTASWTIPPLISLEKLWIVQVLLVLVGHVYSLWVAHRTSLRLFGSSRAALRSQLPMLAGMIAFSVFSLWLLKQPMEMRTSAM